MDVHSRGSVTEFRKRPDRDRHDGAGAHIVYDRGDFQIGFAYTAIPTAEAARLVARRYRWRGYQVASAVAGAPAVGAVTLIAAQGNQLFGTLGVRLGDAGHLQAEALYGAEIAAIRKEGVRVCEFTRLAVDPAHGSRDALAALFHAAYIYAAELNRCDDILIEVNPRHVAFYGRMLGFRRAGPLRVCDRVAAPAVLLRLACGHAGAQIARHGGRGTNERSLYSSFLGASDAAAVRARARACMALHDSESAPRAIPTVVERAA